MLAGAVVAFARSRPAPTSRRAATPGRRPAPGLADLAFPRRDQWRHGESIPCRCRFQGTDYRLGDTVCMNTHLGVQLARCDLFLNNTSWVPIGVPCTMSRLPTRLARR